METPVSRRTLLGGTSAALALSVAGCSALSDDSESEQREPHEVTVVADIDEEELQTAREEAQAAQQEAQQQLEAGEINQTEAQEMVQEARVQFQEAQQELLADAVADLESHAETTDGLEIVESDPNSGVALTEGSGDAIVGALGLDSVQAIVEGSEYESFSGN